MVIDHKRVTMLDAMMPVRMGVWLRPLPAFMFMLVMLIMDMEVLVPKVRMDMLRNCSQKGRVGRCRSGCYFEANEG